MEKKKERKERKERDIWSAEQMELFIKILRERKILSLMDKKHFRKAEIFAMVEKDAKEDPTWMWKPNQIETNYKNLKQQFEKNKKENGKSGNTRKDLEYKEELAEIFGGRPRETYQLHGIETSGDPDPDQTQDDPSVSDDESLDTGEISGETLQSPEVAEIAPADDDPVPVASKSERFKPKVKKKNKEDALLKATKMLLDGTKELADKEAEREEKEAEKDRELFREYMDLLRAQAQAQGK